MHTKDRGRRRRRRGRRRRIRRRRRRRRRRRSIRRRRRRRRRKEETKRSRGRTITRRVKRISRSRIKRWIWRKTKGKIRKTRILRKGFWGDKRGETPEIEGKILFQKQCCFGGYPKPYKQKPARTKPKEPNKSKCWSSSRCNNNNC